MTLPISQVAFSTQRKSSFKSWEGPVEYRILDVEKKPLELTIAANVLHATRSLNKTMEHVRTLLKPGGKLIILEETVNVLRRFPFALLPGTSLSRPSYIRPFILA